MVEQDNSRKRSHGKHQEAVSRSVQASCILSGTGKGQSGLESSSRKWDFENGWITCSGGDRGVACTRASQLASGFQVECQGGAAVKAPMLR